jgi:exopolysaccharide biosynthesis polyprenyl glycosylphosphotransferase
MESSAATTAENHEALAHALPPGWDPGLAVPSSRGAERSSVLAKFLALADFTSALIAASTVSLGAGLGAVDGGLYVCVTSVAWPIVAFSVGLYGGDDLRSWVSDLANGFRGLVGILILSWILFGAASAIGVRSPGNVMIFTLLVAIPIGGIARASVRTALHRVPALRQRTIILGSGVVAGQIVEKVRANAQFGLVPVGIVDDEVHAVGTPDLPRLGNIRDLEGVLRDYQVDRVIIAFTLASHQELLRCIRACRDAGVAIDVIPRLFEFLDGVRALDYVGGLPVLSIGRPRLSKAAQVAKRTLDILVSALLLLAMAPLLVLIALAIRIESRGPVLFRQPRAGRDRRMFNMLKFRSMYINAEAEKLRLVDLNDVSDGVMFKIREDPRVTRVGRVIRRYSLDELPQLWNVLRGDMSLVGPRPLILPETNALAEDWHLRRLELRPGLTGPWQVYGRSQSPFQEMVRFDYQYVAGWSLARDVEIIISTVPVVLSGRGAY